jgi:CubicO group peptidase (beta-lactamase class C family)
MRLNRSIAALALAGCTLTVARAAAPDAPLPRSTPAAMGLSAERLAHMGEYFAIAARRHESAGYVLMVARDGRLVDERAVGFRDLQSRTPMTLDTRFRIASMSKPITAVAVLMLYEQGDFQLDDPISRFLPEFAHERVFSGVDAGGGILTEPAKREITIRDLLTHASGLGYFPGFDRTSPLAKVYAATQPDPHASLADNVRTIAALPLYFQPGTGWRYSYAYDVLGRLVEVVSGMPFAQFLRERIFDPLKMRSTGFSIDAADAASLATMYRREPDGTLEPSHSKFLTDPTDPGIWPSGGGGLYSTAGDYLRFAQMLANGGRFEGRQYLSPVTVSLMTHDQVPSDALFRYFGADSVGLGYGLGVGVIIDAAHSPQADLDGDYAWGGIFDTHWLVSPRTGLVAVLMTQNDPTGAAGPRRTDPDFRTLLFASLESMSAPVRDAVRRAGR